MWVRAGMCERGCANGDVRTGMCERGCANGDVFLTQSLQCSAQCFAGASGGLRAGMYLQERIFNAGFAGFCAVFRRGEQGCVSGDVRTGMCF